MKNIFVKARLSGRRHRHEEQDNGQISAGAVVFVNGLGVVDATVQAREVKLGEANQSLDEQ